MDYLIGVGADRESGRLKPEDLVSRAMWQLGSVGFALRNQSSIYFSPFADGSGPAVYLAAARVFCDRGAAAVFEGARRIAGLVQEGGLWVRPLASWSGCYPDEVTAARAGRGQDVGADVLPDPRLSGDAGLLLAVAEIAPDWRHPLTGQTARELGARLGTANITVVGGLRDFDADRDVAE